MWKLKRNKIFYLRREITHLFCLLFIFTYFIYPINSRLLLQPHTWDFYMTGNLLLLVSQISFCMQIFITSLQHTYIHAVLKSVGIPGLGTLVFFNIRQFVGFHPWFVLIYLMVDRSRSIDCTRSIALPGNVCAHCRNKLVLGTIINNPIYSLKTRSRPEAITGDSRFISYLL